MKTCTIVINYRSNFLVSRFSIYILSNILSINMSLIMIPITIEKYTYISRALIVRIITCYSSKNDNDFSDNINYFLVNLNFSYHNFFLNICD